MLFLVWVFMVGAWGVDGGWMPLPTRPQRYCDPASLALTYHFSQVAYMGLNMGIVDCVVNVALIRLYGRDVSPFLQVGSGLLCGDSQETLANGTFWDRK